MAYLTKKDQMRYIELGGFSIDLNDGDIVALDGVKKISQLYPQKPSTTLIVMCCKGSRKFSANGQSIEIGEGSLLLCPPSLRLVESEGSHDFECRILSISDHIIRGLLRDKIAVWHHAIYMNQLNLINIPSVCGDEFFFYFELIRSKLNSENAAAPFEILMALTRAFLLELCCIIKNANGIDIEHKMSQGKVIFNRFLSLISNSPIKRQPITLYAGKLAITPKYLTMLCLKYSNKTASEWVAQYTVEDIRFYLKSTDLSIKEISARLGFSNMSHFGSYVRKHLGISPSEYRYTSNDKL
jgi:AraC-like DNA-binding protein